MIEKKEIEKLASLARIKLSESEMEGLTKDIDSILGYVDKVKEVSAKIDETKKAGRVMLREDAEPHESGIYKKEIISQAPQNDGDYVVVKKIL